MYAIEMDFLRRGSISVRVTWRCAIEAKSDPRSGLARPGDDGPAIDADVHPIAGRRDAGNYGGERRYVARRRSGALAADARNHRADGHSGISRRGVSADQPDGVYRAVGEIIRDGPLSGRVERPPAGHESGRRTSRNV